MKKKAISFALASSLLAGSAFAGPNDYDGVWNATIACGASIYNEAPYSYGRRITITNGTFSFTRDRLVWNNRFNTTVHNIDNFTGRVENGVLTVSGKGSADQPDIPAWRFDFSGPVSSSQEFNLTGSLIQDGSGVRPAAQNRSCTFAMKRAAPASVNSAATESAVGASGPVDTAPQVASSPSPFIGSWCSTSPGGSLTKLDIHRVDGPAVTGHYKYTGLPTQMDEPMTGAITDGVLRARIGNISWTFTPKGTALDGTAANNRTGATVYVQLKPC